MWTIHFEEVVITAPAPKRTEPRDFLIPYPDYAITRETIEEYKFSLTKNFLQMIPGVFVIDEIQGVSIYLRSFGVISTPMILIDGVMSDPDALLLLPVDAIENIALAKGVNATIFGIRGTNGVISVTTRRGGGGLSEKFNHTVYTPLGYQKPAEFYSPKYETLEAKRSVIPDYRTTIFWKPDLVISDDGKVSFDFYTSDFRATYSVVIEGITDDGRIVRQVEKIRVEL